MSRSPEPRAPGKMAPAIRPQYDKHGASGFYEKFGAEYRNPHEPIIQALLQRALADSPFDPVAVRVLDLACGSGEVTLVLQARGFQEVEGIDPFTGAAYQQRSGLTARPLSFLDIANGALSNRHYDLCICSFALHLATPSLLPNLCLQLASICHFLWVLTPHKQPHIPSAWGWQLKEEQMQNRVRLRRYASLCLQGDNSK